MNFIELIYQRSADELTANNAALKKRNRIFAADQPGAIPKVRLLYTSDAADDPLRVDPGARRTTQKKNTHH